MISRSFGNRCLHNVLNATINCQHHIIPRPRRHIILAVGNQLPTPTVSLGLICLDAASTGTFDQAYKLADGLLYDAKRSGGNRICQTAPP